MTSPHLNATRVPDPRDAARELIRSSAKWLIAAFGAIGAVLVGGSQLSSIGKLDAGSGRLWVAVSAFAVALLSVGASIFAVSGILRPRDWTLAQLDAADRGYDDAWAVTRRLRIKWRVIGWFRANPEYLDGMNRLVTVKQQWDAAGAGTARLDAMNKIVEEAVSNANYYSLDYAHRRLKWKLAACTVLAAGGIGMFAWAANPETKEQPAAVLRGASLISARLGGANLTNADLRDADFTGADLRGANMQGAKVDGATWNDTTCPDGVNTNDIPAPKQLAAPATSASGASAPTTGGCEGHLTP